MRLLCSLFLLGFAVISETKAALPVSARTLAFEESEGLLWVQLETPQSPRPLNFLFDTGAEVSVINADTAKALHLAGGKKICVQGVEAVTTGRWPVKLAATAGGVELPTKYLSLDLSQLAHACKRPLDGLLGADFIRDKILQMDFESHLIRFLDVSTLAQTDIVLPLKSSGDCFCTPIRINDGKNQWVRLDTGCATPLQWVTADAQVPVDAKRPAIGLTGLAIPQTKTTVFLGPKNFEQVPTGLHRRAIFAGESGLLGNGLLNRFKTVTMDTKTLRLVLTPM